MGTRSPVLIESGGGFPFLPLLIMIIAGIIGISVWLAWMFFKSQNKNTDTLGTSTASTPLTPDGAFLSLRRGIAGDWEIYVNGQRYRNLEAVPDETMRQDVVKSIKALASFARKYIQKGTSVPSSIQRANPKVAPSAPATIAPPDLAARLAPSSPARGLDANIPESPPLAASSARAHLTAPLLKRSSAPALFMPTINLAKEIGDIVDAMLALSPTLSQRSIKLLNSMSGGVDFVLDGNIYDDIHNIPDADVKRLIQTAIKEWERRK